MKHNQKVTCEISGTKITDARISIDKDGTPYICQNEQLGAHTNNKLGYKYSWMLNKDFTGENVTNLRPFEKDWDTLQVGDEVELRHEKRTVLGVCGRVIFLSLVDDKDRYYGGYTKEALIKNGYTIVRDKQPIIEIVQQAEQEMKDRCMRAIYEASPTIVGMRTDEAELWGKATTLFLKTLASLDTKQNK